ncbi:hypothetical protein IWW55_003378 [Coemansia sp. RSA 2706]|nr:hypothetical protein LPJ63_002092 [Coemansia sp. RSA 2711]KAJ1843775.1 hypothetical protein LPJ70_003252 [Coemansia sp. RSA 2708]KAJ2302525.1 hypothetical protein IWW55_003378 [Coemansia sp. RSA 2706]KAJ2312956.1 hypothetical protein IWW54_001782 [Coemansia sp. RSA 2705]KAJ2320659.1 hypothetical protein IWW52_001231 [Coemansia sp. RSA 2704]KAJ2326345.1 hypothetical protein IWW51_002320 [Coemansia sp. RSA 2702]KAJ2364169.1 hypothetical protein H4S01_003921 [Coemansia sp. RSA 2610]KAJ238563
MSSWLAVSVAVPLSIGLGTSFTVLRPGAIDWHRRLRKPKYNAPHPALLPLFAVLYTLGGISTYLVSNEMILAQHTSELVAARAGQLGLGFYWLGLTFIVFWPRLLAFGPSLKLALADVVVGGVFMLLAMVQFFRLTAAGGLLMLLCFGSLAALGTWNAALVQIEQTALPF